MANITVSYKGLTGAQGTITIDDGESLDSLIADIAADESIAQTDYYRISLNRNYNINDAVSGDSSNTLNSLGIVTGDEFLCTPNQSGTKQERQRQKLDIAAAKRGVAYDITQLPTRYVGNDVVDNANAEGLLANRPWADVAIVRTNLTLYLDPADYAGSGTTWTADTGGDVTLVGALTWDVTRFVYSSGSAQYVDTNQSLAAESFSIGAWFKVSGTGIKMIMSKESPAGNPWNYRLWLNNGTINFDMSQVTTQSSLTSPSTTYNDNSWHFAMATRDDSNWYLYVDGAQVNTKADPYTGSVTNAQELWIGRSAFTQSGASPTGSYQFTGSLGEIFVYDDVLTAAEVLQNYNATKATYGL